MLKCRRITAADNEAIAKIIRTNLEKMQLNIPGTAYYDPELDHLSTFYNSAPAKRCYFVALDEADRVIGGIGIAEFSGIEACAEMQKLYLDDSAKGKGSGIELVSIAESWAREAGYKQLYLETHSNLKIAMKLYEKLGFKQIEKPASVIHGTMDHFYLKSLSLEVRAYNENDVPAMVRIWNEVVEEGVAFPQLETLDEESGREFFAAQTYCAVAEDNGTIVGLYILHPNNVGRCGHIANASYAVDSSCRGKHIGEHLVADCLIEAKKHGFRLLQFNAVVENNIHARHLYERLGFVQLGTIPGGFQMKDGTYQNICLYYHEL